MTQLKNWLLCHFIFFLDIIRVAFSYESFLLNSFQQSGMCISCADLLRSSTACGGARQALIGYVCITGLVVQFWCLVQIGSRLHSDLYLTVTWSVSPAKQRTSTRYVSASICEATRGIKTNTIDTLERTGRQFVSCSSLPLLFCRSAAAGWWRQQKAYRQKATGIPIWPFSSRIGYLFFTLAYKRDSSLIWKDQISVATQPQKHHICVALQQKDFRYSGLVMGT